MRILSGIQPTGMLHIGNYLGAIKQWVEFQENNECFFVIVDLHAITVDYNPDKMQEIILDTAATYLAAGIDPKKSVIFVQSQIKEHAELAWLLETLTPMGDLERMTQFKQKAEQNKKNINAGLFSYPVLMASDILLYKTQAVPVGEDQIQHIELTRYLAKRFNNKFGKVFEIPKVQLSKSGARIMSLNDPTQKMSKSAGSQDYVGLSDSPDIIRKKIKSAVTDSGEEIKCNKNSKPAISNLLNIYQSFSNKSIKELEKQYKNKRYSEFKNDLAEVIIDGLKSFQEKKQKYISNPKSIRKALNQGQKRAQKIANQTIKEAKQKMGLL